MLRRWLYILRVPLVLIVVGLFFTLYNRFILDENLEDLKTSLSVLDSAANIHQAEATLLLMDQTLIAQMAREELDLRKLATIQFAQGTLTSAELDRPVADSQMMLATLAENAASKRPGFLSVIDGIVTGIQGTIERTTLAPRQLLGTPTSGVIDNVTLEEAFRLERVGLLDQAARHFEQLLIDYPNYTQKAGLKLRLGRLYQRMGETAQAETLYREAAKEARTPEEAAVTRRMLSLLSAAKKKSAQTSALLNQLERLGPGPERQKAAFDLGAMLIERYEFRQAAQLFREAVEANPDGDLAPAALFKEAWCFRNSGQIEEALTQFLKLSKTSEGSAWADAALLQAAEIYRSTGDYKTAASLYERTISRVDDNALAAILHTQAGAIYRYDLKDLEKSETHFKKLASSFPASDFSDTQEQLKTYEETQEQAPRGALLPPSPEAPLPTKQTAALTTPAPPAAPREPTASSLIKGSPVIKWLERYLPSFADIFIERLTKYMESSGRETLSRKFTEEEFQYLIVRRIQQRFPQQVTNLKTKITPDGFVGSGKVALGAISFTVSVRIGIKVVSEKPHVLVKEVRIGKLRLAKPLREFLQGRINASIEKADYPLKIKEYKLGKGFAEISVELDSSARTREPLETGPQDSLP